MEIATMHDMSKETFLRPDQLKRGVEIELTQRPEWGTAFIRGRVRGKPQLWEISKSMDKRGRFVYEDELLQHWRTPNMSNTRKEIAARIGFAAGNGAKTRMDRSDGNYFLISAMVDNAPTGERSFDTKAEAEYYGKQMLEATKQANPKAKSVKVSLMEVVNMSPQAPFKTLSSRPGAKASFGRAEDVYRLLETTPSSYNNAKKLDALATEAMRLADITPAGKDVSLHELAEMVGQDLEADRSRMSRPGAKAEFAAHPSWSEGILGKDTDPKLAAYSWISKNNIESGRKQMLLADLAAGMYEKNPSMSIAQAVLAAAKDMVSKGVATRDIQQWAENGGKFARPGTKTRMTREQTEEQKAGLKIMSAADPAVGAKIATLIKEGKPQDQAVAIALDMKRRGEL
jgi:hypothetical protein